MDTFTPQDKHFMEIAITEAKAALENSNYSVGAVLVVNGEMIGKEQNRKEVKKDHISHAETLLFFEHTELIRKVKKDQAKIELYTTFEPCLMCLGTAIIHRTDRIIIACPDPRGDTTQIDPQKIGEWYQKNWPAAEFGLCFKESYDLFMTFLNKNPGSEISQSKRLFLQLKDKYE